MLEFGPHLLPMLDRYAECCRGDHGEGGAGRSSAATSRGGGC